MFLCNFNFNLFYWCGYRVIIQQQQKKFIVQITWKYVFLSVINKFHNKYYIFTTFVLFHILCYLNMIQKYSNLRLILFTINLNRFLLNYSTHHICTRHSLNTYPNRISNKIYILLEFSSMELELHNEMWQRNYQSGELSNDTDENIHHNLNSSQSIMH